MASATSSGVWYPLLGHVNGLYACLRTRIHHGEQIKAISENQPLSRIRLDVKQKWKVIIQNRRVGSDVCRTREESCERLIPCVACVACMVRPVLTPLGWW